MFECMLQLCPQATCCKIMAYSLQMALCKLRGLRSGPIVCNNTYCLHHLPVQGSVELHRRNYVDLWRSLNALGPEQRKDLRVAVSPGQACGKACYSMCVTYDAHSCGKACMLLKRLLQASPCLVPNTLQCSMPPQALGNAHAATCPGPNFNMDVSNLQTLAV